MRENIKISKIDKKKKQTIKTIKKTATVSYLSDKCFKMKVYKMLECQINVYVPTFM